MFKIIRIINGELYENCYIIHNDKKALIIDPGSEEEKIYNIIDKLNLKVVGILITHYHNDHTACLNEVKNKYKVDVIDYKNRIEKVDIFEYKIIENYGHTLDSVSYYFEKEKIMFTGDFIFKEGIGKFSLKNEKIMKESLKRFCNFDKDIMILPGHGDCSCVGFELENNYFLKRL